VTATGSAGRRGPYERGAALVEFALIGLVLYLLLAALLSFGTMVQAAQVAQDTARLAARELALTPLPAVTSFEEALALTRDRVFDPNQLVVDLDAVADSGMDLDEHFASMPLVNRALRPVFVFDQVGGRRLLRFPGALLLSPEPTAFNAGLTVGVPQIVDRSDAGETSAGSRSSRRSVPTPRIRTPARSRRPQPDRTGGSWPSA